MIETLRRGLVYMTTVRRYRAAMGIKISGGSIGVGGFGLDWTVEPGDDAVARRVIVFLEDRRVLFGNRHMEDEDHCIQSAIEIRRFLTEQLNDAKPGKSLADSLRQMRAACRRFVDAGGPHGRGFIGYQQTAFWLALGELRTLVGQQVGLIARQYDIEVEDELAGIVPMEPDDHGN